MKIAMISKSAINRTIAAVSLISILYVGSYVIYRLSYVESAEQWSSRNKGFPLYPYKRALEVNGMFPMVFFYPLLELDRDLLKTFVEFKKVSAHPR